MHPLRHLGLVQMQAFHSLLKLPRKHPLGGDLPGLLQATFLLKEVFEARADVPVFNHHLHLSSL